MREYIVGATMLETYIRFLLTYALQAQATVRGFNLDSKAATFFAGRAYTRIAQRSATNAQMYDAAAQAIVNAPAFFRRIEQATTNRSFLTEASAESIVRQLTYDCVYPWCKDAP